MTKTVGDILERTLRYEIQKRRVVEAHVSAKKRALVRNHRTTRKELKSIETLTNQRMDLAMRVVAADLAADLEALERATVDMSRPPMDARQIEDALADAMNRSLFFRELYDFRHPPVRPSGEDVIVFPCVAFCIVSSIAHIFSLV